MELPAFVSEYGLFGADEGVWSGDSLLRECVKEYTAQLFLKNNLSLSVQKKLNA